MSERERFEIQHYEGDPADGIVACDSDPEWPSAIEIGDEARAHALLEALAAHLGRDVAPEGWGKPQEQRVLARGWIVEPSELVGDRQSAEDAAAGLNRFIQDGEFRAVYVEIREADPPAEGSAEK